MKTVNRILGGLALLTAVSSLGHASTISFWTSIFNPAPGSPVIQSSGTPLATVADFSPYASTATLYSTTTNGFQTTVSLPRFDQTVDATHINVLDSVQLVIGWAALGAVDVTNTNTSQQNFISATSTVPLSFSMPAVGFLLGPCGATPDPSCVHATAGPFSGTVPGQTTTQAYRNVDYSSLITQFGLPTAKAICSLNSGTWVDPSTCKLPDGLTTTPGTTEVGGVTRQYGVGSTPTLTSSLGNYQGFGVNNLVFTVSGDLGQYTGSAVPGVSFSGSASAGGVAEIVYTYHLTSTPEPVTMTLVGGALLGLAVVSRRRRSKKS